MSRESALMYLDNSKKILKSEQYDPATKMAILMFNIMTIYDDVLKLENKK